MWQNFSLEPSEAPPRPAPPLRQPALARGRHLKWIQAMGGRVSAKLLPDLYGHFLPTESTGCAAGWRIWPRNAGWTRTVLRISTASSPRISGNPATSAGLPEEIGAVIAFRPSRTNSYMTGADVNVDGGSDFA